MLILLLFVIPFQFSSFCTLGNWNFVIAYCFRYKKRILTTCFQLWECTKFLSSFESANELELPSILLESKLLLAHKVAVPSNNISLTFLYSRGRSSNQYVVNLLLSSQDVSNSRYVLNLWSTRAHFVLNHLIYYSISA